MDFALGPRDAGVLSRVSSVDVPESRRPSVAGTDPSVGFAPFENVVRGEVRQRLPEKEEGEGVHWTEGRRLNQGSARAVVSKGRRPCRHSWHSPFQPHSRFVRSSLNRTRRWLPPPPRYPGHIAKAERMLKERLKAVDVILELRDARIPFSTEHPDVSERKPNVCRTLSLCSDSLFPAGNLCFVARACSLRTVPAGVLDREEAQNPCAQSGGHDFEARVQAP